MATTPRPDPLKVMDQMFKETLIQTGKALKTTLKEGPKNISSINSPVRSKMPDILAIYHDALDDIESEIVRAKSVLIRDLEKLRAARLPAPVPAPQPVVSQAPVTDFASSAAHTTNPPPFAPHAENRPVAPFPDMGMGDVVDLTLGDKKPSPRVPPGTIKPSAQRSPSLKNEVKPSPKTAHKPTPPKPTPKSMPPAKVTPVPPPQIPRLQPSQPATASQPGSTQATQPQSQPGPQRKQSASQPVPRAPAAQATQAMPLGSGSSLPAGSKAGDANAAAASGSELGFTAMQFSLAPSANESQNAPPAPMPEFDLTSFAPQDSNNEMLSMGGFSADATNTNASTSGAGGANNSAATQVPKAAEKTDANLDDLFDLDNGSGGDNMDLDLDLGTGGATDSNFDELFAYTNDADMGQFDNAYFGLE